MEARATFLDQIDEGSQGSGHESAGEIKLWPFKLRPSIREDGLRIPTMPASVSDMKPATYSDFKPATV
ncbi:hypothetical protein, partial [Lichenifustis flavocetrariae]